MSLYRPNHNKTFIFAALLLFSVLLLMISLRPSTWDRDEALAEGIDSLEQLSSDRLLRQDSLVLTTVSTQDSQLVLTANEDSSALDTSFVVSLVERVDTTFVAFVSPPPLKTIETNPIQPLFLLWWLLLLIAVAWLIYKLITARWQKKYWLEYNATLQPLATLSKFNSSIDFDFATISLDPLSVSDQSEDASIEDFEEEISPVTEIVEDSILIDTEALEETVEHITDEQPKEDRNIAESQIEPSNTTTPNTLATTTNKTPFSRRWYVLFLMEFFGRLPRILLEIGRGIGSIFSFFSTGNQKKKPLDLKWQDGVSVIMILFFIACKSVIFPDTSVAVNIFLGLLVWSLPALLRLHWSGGAVGIFIIFGELVSLIIYVILQALKDAPPGDGDYTIYWIIAAVLASISLLYWTKKKNLLPKLGFLNMGRLAFLIPIVLILFFFQQINALGDSWGIYYDWSSAVVKLIGFYIFYEILISSFSSSFSKKKKPTPVTDQESIVNKKQIEPDQKTPLKEEKTFTPISQEALKELFRTKDWYKKTALDQLDMVSIPNTKLDEQSEFIVLYLPDCINLNQLYLSNNNFQEIPYEVSTLEQLEILNLSYNNIHTIFPEIEYLKNLKTLFLAHNNISEIPSELANLDQLTQIDLSGNPLTAEAIKTLETYFPNATLKFDSPKIEEIVVKKVINEVPQTPRIETEASIKVVQKILHKELKNPEQIYALSTLMNKELTDLPFFVLQKFPNLNALFLNSNLFVKIPEAIYQLPNLTILGLSYNKINSLPDKIHQLKNLQELNLSGNPIQSFSPQIIQLPNLKKIALGNIGLTVFPAFLLKMQQLEQINLSGNHILRIPESIQDLSNLKELDLSFSGLNIIPKDIFALENLRSLNWTGNNLVHIPSEIIALEKLEKLSIGFNPNLESSTNILEDLPNLKELYISGLKGGAKHPMILDVGILKELQVLWLSYNEFQDLPVALFDLKKIRRLSLANNKLETLSEQLGELSNLEYLYLEKNQLTKLPNSIKKLKKLRHLDLSDNPIEIREKRALQRILPNVTIHF